MGTGAEEHGQEIGGVPEVTFNWPNNPGRRCLQLAVFAPRLLWHVRVPDLSELPWPAAIIKKILDEVSKNPQINTAQLLECFLGTEWERDIIEASSEVPSETTRQALQKAFDQWSS